MNPRVSSRKKEKTNPQLHRGFATMAVSRFTALCLLVLVAGTHFVSVLAEEDG
jgi:hypothetical protein